MKIYDVHVIHCDGRSILRKEFEKSDLDPVLISGFLKALEDFAQEALPSREALEVIEKGKIKIVFSRSKHVIVALICELDNNENTQQIKYKLNKLTKVIEEKYGAVLEEWNGATNKFQDLEKLVEEFFKPLDRVTMLPSTGILETLVMEYRYMADNTGKAIYDTFYKTSRSLEIFLKKLGIDVDKVDKLIDTIMDNRMNATQISARLNLPLEITIKILRDLALRDIVSVWK
ncbi:MAG: hypothetical protein ACTSSJ_06145 [Candidatus Odinarchaeia archaeon]